MNDIRQIILIFTIGVGGSEMFAADKSETIEKADKIVLPGVGAFKDAKEGLQERNLVEPIINHIKNGKLFLGICLGLQLLFTRSIEDGIHEGLNIVPGEVVRFEPGKSSGGDNQKLKIPHMGWNTIRAKKEVPILKGLPDNSYMYFVHSYYVIPDRDDVVATETEYGGAFVSMISIDNVFAMQFHPEKSQHYGLMILKNFGEL